ARRGAARRPNRAQLVEGRRSPRRRLCEARPCRLPRDSLMRLGEGHAVGGVEVAELRPLWLHNVAQYHYRTGTVVPSGLIWSDGTRTASLCAWQESNLRPCAPEAHALSPELQT